MSWEDLENAPREQEGEGWKGEVYGFCPVQGKGTVDGLWWYFRARWFDWSFDVFTEEPKWDGKSYDHFKWGSTGGHDNASWMPHADAWRIIKEQLDAFRASQRQGSGE